MTGRLINNRNLFHIVLEVEKSKMKAVVDVVFCEDLLPGPQMTIFSLCPHMAKGVRELSGNSFMRAQISSPP